MKKLIYFSLLLASATAAEFPEPYNSEADTSAVPMPAGKAAAAFDLPEGFEISVFAAEPDVQNPIAMTWDHRGRMWVAENYTYAEKTKRFDLSLRDRILILTDEDFDGKADSRRVFLDDLQMLTSVEVGRGGVWLMCPPQLLFVPDRDGDDVPDGEPEVVLDGFTVAQSNYHNFANGLRWGPDGWLYGRCGHSCPGKLGTPGTPDEERVPIEGGIWRFHPERKVVEVLTHGTTNPWGHDWDKHGELFFINTVNGHLWHGIPGAHFTESFGQDPNPLVFHRLDMHADHWHFDRSGSWMDSRDGAANEFGGGHAHIGMMIYQADQWPEKYRDRLFTLNMHGRRANVEKLERHGSGYLARHQDDVFLAGDEWFRGMEISTGPDGSAYILDWSDTGECHDHTGVHRTSGRIYRISYGQPEKPELAAMGVNDWTLRHPNAWSDRQARILAAGTKPDAAHVEELQQILAYESAPGFRLRALWRLNALDSLPRARLLSLLDDPDEHLRVWAIRLLTDHSPLDSIYGPMPHRKPDLDPELIGKFTSMARNDNSALVRLTLASTLQRTPVKKRAELGAALASRVEDANDHNLPSMVWYGLIPLVNENPQALVEVAAASDWPDTLRWIARALAAGIEENAQPVEGLLKLAAQYPDKRTSLLNGLNDAFQGWRKAPKPGNWDALVATVPENAPDRAIVRDLSALFGDGRALDEIKAVVFNQELDLPMRQAALKTLIDARPPDLRELCESLLDERPINATAARGLAVFDDPEIGRMLAGRYRKFWPQERGAIMDVLVSRPSWAAAMLDNVDPKKIPKSDITAYHARQIRAFGDEKLNERLSEVWGDIRETNEAKQERMAELKAQLTPENLADADLAQGRLYYEKTCAACHQLYGQGGQLGPDLTGSGRADLDYLLENIVDPSAVVSADYKMTLVTLKDGRVLSGVIASQTDRTLTVRLLNEETTVEKSEIADRMVSPVSMMPEGLLQTLDAVQIRDLIAYLMHPRQVDLGE